MPTPRPERFFRNEEVAVPPIAPAEHARIHPLALLVRADEHRPDGIPRLPEPVAVREVAVEGIETFGLQGLVDLPEHVPEDEEVPDHHAERKGKFRGKTEPACTLQQVLQFCCGREQDDERDADEEFHRKDAGKFHRLCIDVDPEREGRMTW